MEKFKELRGKKYKFWLDKLARQLIKKFPKEKVFHLNCGLSVRGPQHVGRMRGELCIPDCIKRILKEKYKREAIHYITLYDMDGLKAKGAKNGFPNDPEKQRKYTGVSLFNIPDPYGCHKNWFEHFWEDFGNYLNQFGFEVKIVRTSEFYKTEGAKKIVKWILENREKVIETVNRFRLKNPWPEDFIPINPICNNCLSINDTKATSFDLKKWVVDYECKKCGNRGRTSLENAKLQWRLEWVSLWKVLHIEFEPYGKDHAVAGGSRETCNIFSTELLKYQPPLGEWNDWVSLKMHGKRLGEMTASGFIGITPKQWLEVAEPEVLRYLYISTKPHAPITIDMDRIFVYHDKFDRAERIYFGVEKTDERELHNIRRSFELAQVREIPSKPLFQLKYDFAAQLVQILPEKNRVRKAIEILTKIGQLKGRPKKSEIARISKRLELSKNWVEKYAPEKYKFKIVEKIAKKEMKKLSEKQKKALINLGKFLEKTRTDKAIWDKIREIADELHMKPEKIFEAAYLVLLGKNYGPRLVPLIQSLDKEFVVSRFKLKKIKIYRSSK